jgi:hypothetical protein
MVSMMSVYNVVQFSYRLTLIPDALQGWVNSTFRLLAFGFNPVGTVLSGLLLELVGVRLTVVVFASWYLLLATLAIFNTHVKRAVPMKQAL